MGKIRFLINYEANLKKRLEQFLKAYEQEIGFSIQGLKIERCLRIEGEFEATFFVETATSEKAGSVYEVLIMANQLSSSSHSVWKFNGPFVNSGLVFGCLLDNRRDDQPLKSASIEIENE